MPLTDEEKNKIIEEERIRAQARKQFSQKTQLPKQGFGQRELKHPFLTGLLIVGALIAVAAFFVSSGDQDDEEGSNNPSTAPAELTSPADQEKAAAEQQAQQDARKTFNDKRGNNAEAAATAEALESILTLAGIEKGSIDLYAEVSAPDGATKKYEEGGDNKEYRSAVTNVRLIAIVSNNVWTLTSDSTKKDLVVSFIRALKVDYPNSIPNVIVNNGIRTVAEGSWSVWSGEPKVDLK